MPSGAIDDCGSSPSGRATCLAGSDWMTCAVEQHPAVPLGLSIRDRARSSVDLPQAFGPTMTVKELSGISTDSRSAITRWS